MQNVTGLRTVEWKNNKVIMIEQTKLPNELIFVEYDDFHQVANAIKTLIVRGAPAIEYLVHLDWDWLLYKVKRQQKKNYYLTWKMQEKFFLQHDLLL